MGATAASPVAVAPVSNTTTLLSAVAVPASITYDAGGSPAAGVTHDKNTWLPLTTAAKPVGASGAAEHVPVPMRTTISLDAGPGMPSEPIARTRTKYHAVRDVIGHQCGRRVARIDPREVAERRGRARLDEKTGDGFRQGIPVEAHGRFR